MALSQTALHADRLAGRRIARMNGAGNKILVLDLRGASFAPTAEEARAINRGAGLDYDQLMALRESNKPDVVADVLIYNNDGSLSGACGNGARCVAERLCRETGADRLTIETAAGPIACERLGPWTYRVDMGAPRLRWDQIPLRDRIEDTRRVDLRLTGAEAHALGTASTVNMGNPHAIFFVDDAAAIDVPRLGPWLEVHPMFPEKANITFAQILARDDIKARVWERGVGVTLACGSAACATVVAAARLGRADRKARVRLPGGDLVIEWRETDDRVLMTGPVEFEREITLDASLFAETESSETARA